MSGGAGQVMGGTRCCWIVALAWSLAAPGRADQQWTHHATLASDGSVRISWRIHDGNFTCQVVGDTLGWVGFGLSPNGAMRDSDMVVAGVMSDGTAYLTDMNSASGYSLTKDVREDYYLVEASENATSTRIVFTRRLLTSCEPNDVPGEDRDISADTQYVLYAYHSRDPHDPDSPQRHEFRGHRTLHLTDPAPPPDLPQVGSEDTSDLITWPLTIGRATLPAKSTVYWCNVVRTPRLRTRHHVIRYRPLIQPGNERVVHHMVLYQCKDRDFSPLEDRVDAGGYECYTPNMPPAARACRGIIAGWGVGGEDFLFPEDVGFPVGPGQGVDYYILEIHYDLGARQGVTDSSGLEFTLTSRLRPTEASMMTLGHDVSPLLIVPPRVSNFTVVGHCSDECLQLALPEGGITVFAALPHTHLLGRQIRLRHFRGDKELPHILEDNNYDFNYQQMRHVRPAQVLPGDQLTVECVYDSSLRPQATLGGLSTQEEMCNMFIQYYPALNFSNCVSTPTPDVLKAVGISKAKKDPNRRYGALVVEPAMFRDKTLEIYLNQFNWTEQGVEDLQKASVAATHIPECYGYGRHVLSTTRNTTEFPGGSRALGYVTYHAPCERQKSLAVGSSSAAQLVSTVALLFNMFAFVLR